MSRSVRLALLASSPLWLFAVSSGSAQDPPTPAPPAAKKKLTEEEEFILTLFESSQKSFNEEDRLVLVYDFATKDETLVNDWKPELARTRQRIRWSGRLEGTFTTIEDGIVIGDQGQWLHEAVWLPDVTVKVELISVAQYRDGTILAPIFYDPKKKLSLGANGGAQIVCLRGTRHAKRPHPPAAQPIVANNRLQMGYKFEKGHFHALTGSRSRADTVEVPKLVEGFERGHVGLAWTGSVQSFIFSVTIEGRLDPEWVKAQRKAKK